MDISVSRLNNRLALQLPSELPLGLVFVLGRVQNLSQTEPDSENSLAVVTFQLTEKGHSIFCQLSPRAAAEVVLTEDSLIRAGGHLSFNPARAEYFLFARDVEIIAEQPDVGTVDVGTVDVGTVDVGTVDVGVVTEPSSRLERTGVTKALIDVKKRSESIKTEPSDLPGWVQRMAPPGLAVESESEETGSEETAVATDPAQIATPLPALAAEQPPINQELIDFVNRALESEEDMELTPELLDKFAIKPAADSERQRSVSRTKRTGARPTGPTSQPKQQTDWLAVVLLLILVILLLIAAATFLLLWLR
jgi:hypothetical protein